MKIFNAPKSALLLARLIIGIWPKPAKKAARYIDAAGNVIEAAEPVVSTTKAALDKVKAQAAAKAGN